ncbi:MAG: hypothetical protein AABY22_03150 [Nanoarchaeota archaeon]
MSYQFDRAVEFIEDYVEQNHDFKHYAEIEDDIINTLDCMGLDIDSSSAGKIINEEFEKYID